jgi:hypothetical protein
MKKLIILGVIAAGLYFVIPGEPSTESIVSEMDFDPQIMYQGESFHSDWATDTESIKGYVRRVDRHYDENIPIVTFNLVITTGEFNDPDIVNVRYKGGGNYFWSSKTQPEGSILFFHTVPNSMRSQSKLDKIKEGDSVEILAKVSENSEISSDSGAFVKLMHSNHKFILVEDVR